MRFQPIFVAIGLALGIIIGCNTQNPNVQDIIPAEVDPPRWFLSPSGDKLLYHPRAIKKAIRPHVHFLATGQDVVITAVADCPQFRWLTNETIYCYDYQNSRDIPTNVISNVSVDNTVSKIPIKTIAADQIELSTLLKRAKAIYQLQPSPGMVGDSLLILDTKPQESTKRYYYVTRIENLDEVLKNYNYISFSLYGEVVMLFEKIYSPNKAYYSLVKEDGLGIYDATSDQLLTEVKPPTNRKSYFRIGGYYSNESGGWAADSSGVYFQIYHTIGLGPRPPVWPIQKLCVPGAAGCSAAN